MPTVFRSRAHGDVVMRNEDAEQLLRLMGHTGTVPSALATEDLATARATLQQAVDHAPEPDSEEDSKNDHEPGGESVDLRRRAWPLLDMLAAAERKGQPVEWFRG